MDINAFERKLKGIRHNPNDSDSEDDEPSYKQKPTGKGKCSKEDFHCNINGFGSIANAYQATGVTKGGAGNSYPTVSFKYY